MSQWTEPAAHSARVGALLTLGMLACRGRELPSGQIEGGPECAWSSPSFVDGMGEEPQTAPGAGRLDPLARNS